MICVLYFQKILKCIYTYIYTHTSSISLYSNIIIPLSYALVPIKLGLKSWLKLNYWWNEEFILSFSLLPLLREGMASSHSWKSPQEKGWCRKGTISYCWFLRLSQSHSVWGESSSCCPSFYLPLLVRRRPAELFLPASYVSWGHAGCKIIACFTVYV